MLLMLWRWLLRKIKRYREKMGAYIEDTLTQQTTADYLERQLGWTSVYAHNNEDSRLGCFLSGDTGKRRYE
jgi:hypothetical protein